MDRDAWSAAVHGVTKSWMRLSDCTELNWAILMAESKEELKSLLMRVKGESERVGLKLNIPKSNIMAYSLITSCEIDQEKMGTVADSIFSGSKITADGDCTIIKKCLFLWRKAMKNLDSVLKSRGIILPTKVHLVKVMVFPVVIYGFESWTIKKAEQWRIDAFQLWCWRRLLKSLLDSKEIKPDNLKGNQPWILIGRTGAEAEAPILWSLDTNSWHWNRPWCWERLKADGEGRDRGWHGWIASVEN